MISSFQAGIILHYRLYRETSLLLDCFTQEQGRVSIVARGARRASAKQRGLLQPFQLLWLQWSGMRDLVTLRSAESMQAAFQLQGKAIWCGFYLNELLQRTLQPGVAFPSLFEHYLEALRRLSMGNAPEAILRLFERDLLHALGYGLQLSLEVNTGQPISPDVYYRYESEEGPIRSELTVALNQTNLYRGSSLLALAAGDLSESNVLQDAKRLLRRMLKPVVGHKPFKTRELFLQLEQF